MFNNNNPFLNNYPYGNNNYMANPNMVPQYGNYTTPQQQYEQPQQAPQPQQSQMVANTNKIYVNGIDGAKSKNFPLNSEYILLDNDNPEFGYVKKVDNIGRTYIQPIKITLCNEQDIYATKPNTQSSVDMSQYVLKSDFDKLTTEISDLKSKINNIGGNNGNTKQSRANNKETEN